MPSAEPGKAIDQSEFHLESITVFVAAGKQLIASYHETPHLGNFVGADFFSRSGSEAA